MIRTGIFLVLILVAPVLGQVVSWEGNSFPEKEQWNRNVGCKPIRWLEDGWYFQHLRSGICGPPPGGDRDTFRTPLDPFIGAGRFFIEWRVESTGSREEIDGVAPAAMVAAGLSGVGYNFVISKDLVRFARDFVPGLTWIRIEPGEAHTYRLELFEAELFIVYVDGEEITRGEPNGPFPRAHDEVIWRGKSWFRESTNRWDYIRYGVIPEDGSGDFDSDDDVDRDDYYFFHECLAASGPGVDAGPGCRFADFDHDTDVDLDDFVMFQALLTDSE